MHTYCWTWKRLLGSMIAKPDAFQGRLTWNSPRARVSLQAAHDHLREKHWYLAGVQAMKLRFFLLIYRKYLHYLFSSLPLYNAGSPKVPPRVFGPREPKTLQGQQLFTTVSVKVVDIYLATLRFAVNIHLYSLPLWWIIADRQPPYSWSHPEILVRPIVRIKKQPIRNPVIWHSLANQQLSCKKNWHVLAQEKIVLDQGNTVDQSQGFLSVNILEAVSVHLCHLQLCFSIDRIWSIYGYKQMSMTSYVMEIACIYTH